MSDRPSFPKRKLSNLSGEVLHDVQLSLFHPHLQIKIHPHRGLNVPAVSFPSAERWIL